MTHTQPIDLDVNDLTIRTYNRRPQGPAVDIDMAREMARFVALLPAGGRVLDLGCGSAWAAARLGAQGYSSIGLDLSFRRLRDSAPIRPSPLVMGDMRRLPIADASLDGVWACASLLHLAHAEMPMALAAIRAALRLGGALYVSLKAGAGEAWQIRGGGPRFFAYYTDAELDGLLAAAGFTVVDGWTSPPPNRDPAHAWLNRLAVVVTASPSGRERE